MEIFVPGLPLLPPQLAEVVAAAAVELPGLSEHQAVTTSWHYGGHSDGVGERNLAGQSYMGFLQSPQAQLSVTDGPPAVHDCL